MLSKGEMDAEDLRHKIEEGARRLKRKEARVNKSSAQIEKEQRRRKHAQRFLDKQNIQHKKNENNHQFDIKSHNDSSSTLRDGGSSIFQSLFSKRAEGFIIDLKFRNTPPRPPVGPCFVGLGLNGELNDKWTRYRPNNSIERNYIWRLHAEPNVGVPLAPSAMDLNGCYIDPEHVAKRRKNGTDKILDLTVSNTLSLHPDDCALLNWKGSLKDTAAEKLQISRDRARAAARAQANCGKIKKSRDIPSLTKSSTIQLVKGNKSFKSRVLKERNPFFMKKTTYLTNDQSESVHSFLSLAETKRQTAKEIEQKIEEKKDKDADIIEESFRVMKMRTNSKLNDSDYQLHNNDTSPHLRHHNKVGVVALKEYPLFPDSLTWGHTYTHIVLENLPRGTTKRPPPSPNQLARAFIVDAEHREQNLRMECNLLLPTILPIPINVHMSDDTDEEKIAPLNESNKYYVSHRFDLDVIPLKEESKPHVNFLLMIDKTNNIATYHPVSSRVQLSNGRPVGENINSNTTIVTRCVLREKN